MNELDSTPPSWITYLIGGIVTLLGGMFEYYRRKVDSIEKAYMSKEEFKDYMAQMRQDRLQMHQENLDRLKAIDGGMERVHARIDQLFSGKTK